MLTIVTDQELLASQAVKIIMLLILLFGAGYNAYISFRNRHFTRVVMTVIFIALSLPFIRWIVIEDSLLRNARYTVGVTTGYCQEFARGRAIEFAYDIDGRTYLNCNTYHPIPVDSIVVPGGKYVVRYSDRYPDRGRMDYRRKDE